MFRVSWIPNLRQHKVESAKHAKEHQKIGDTPHVFSTLSFQRFSDSADCPRINFHNPRRETQQNRFLGVKKEINENQTTWTGCDPYFGRADICRPAWRQERICNYISTRARSRTCKTGSSSI